MTEKIEVSVIAPVFNERENLREMHERLTKVLKSLNRSYEIIFVNDGSTDGSGQILAEIAQQDDNVTVIEFNRNYGQHQAVFAGFENARGEVIVTIDSDLQNPPEEIPKLLQKLNEGYEVVFTIRENRKDSLFRKFASYVRNKITAKTTGVRLKDYGSMLVAYKREIVDAMCSSQEVSTYIPLLATRYASPQKIAQISVKHSARTKGKSKYGPIELIMLEFDLITSFSLWPLRMMMVLGAVVSICSILLGLFLLIMRIIMGSQWAAYGVFTLFAVLFAFVGAQFFALGLLGEYIGRIYSEVRRRPRFIIKSIYPKREKEK
jgi:undecaprenyl-phosphate 4-deoxy-4-formamido-L-arabinose transferase